MAGVALVLYARGSGVYGDLGELEAAEDHGPMVPDVDLRRQQAGRRGAPGVVRRDVRLHRARASASATWSARSQTHGVGFDFVRRLLDDPTRLRILGDGQQSKSYIYVEDVIDAVLLAGSQARHAVRRLQRRDRRLRHRHRDRRARDARCSASSPGPTTFEYTGGDRGWKGDVPVVRIATGKIRALGWAQPSAPAPRRCATR